MRKYAIFSSFSSVKTKRKRNQAAENVNSVPDTVTVIYTQFCFRWFRSGNSDVKNAPPPGRPIVEIIDKIKEIVECDHHVSTISIDQELNIA